jgi:phosphatidylinositol alpha-1,6-mannosyltransferase
MAEIRPSSKVDRKKILVVTRNFPPLVGGMERLNHQVFLGLAEGNYEVALCGPHRSEKYAEGYYCRTFAPGPAWKYAVSSLYSTFKAAKEFKPDVVYAGSGLAAHAAVCAAHTAKAKSCVFLHGLDLVAEHAIYQRLFLPAIRKCDFFFVNSRNTASLAIARGIPENRLHIAHPGTELPDDSLRAEKRRAFREKFNLGDRPVLLSAGRLSPRKGIVEFIDHCLPKIIQHSPQACLMIIGDTPTEGLGANKANLKAQINDVIARQNLQNNVQLLGRCDDATLSSAYFAADVFVFPILETPGDVEGFGMVALEAAAHGLQTVAYAVGGVPDAVNHGISGRLVRSGDYEAFSHAVIESITHPLPRTAIRDFASQFSWNTFHKKVAEIIEQHTSPLAR